jgi:hypothetical protein
MQAIAKLSGQEYVDIDARRAKAELAAAADGGTSGAGEGDGEGGNAGHREDDAPLVPHRNSFTPGSSRIHPHGPSRALRLMPCEWESLPAAATAPA